MINRKLWALTAALLILVTLLGACQQEEAAKTIAYVAWNMNNPWSVKLRDAIKESVEANGDTFVEADPAGDPAKQIPQIETFIGQGVDGIILTPTDSTALLPSIDAADEAGIPVVIVGAGIEEGAWKAAILTDNFQGGKQIGEYVVEKLGGVGKVLATNLPGIEDAELRQAGWEAAFEGTDIEILDYQMCATVELGVTAMENWLQKYAGEEIGAMIGCNDPTALGALTVIEEANLQDEIFVVGVDGSDEAIQAMTDCRSFGASAAQQPEEMGKRSAETLYKVLAGEEIAERVVRIPTMALMFEDYCTE
jgi:ribose transport system substrate-binding protein